jgi:MtN3 and saliva related transmembrane protein
LFLQQENKVVNTQLVGLVAGICTALSLLPQLIKLIRQKKAEDLSLFYLFILFVGIGLWIWYGALRDDLPIIATNALSLLLNAVIIILSIHYKRNPQ